MVSCLDELSEVGALSDRGPVTTWPWVESTQIVASSDCAFVTAWNVRLRETNA